MNAYFPPSEPQKELPIHLSPIPAPLSVPHLLPHRLLTPITGFRAAHFHLILTSPSTLLHNLASAHPSQSRASGLDTHYLKSQAHHCLIQTAKTEHIRRTVQMAHTMSEAELQEIYTFALDLGRRAGRILTDGVERRCGDVAGREGEGDGMVHKEKMNAVDIVTQTDLGTSSSYLLITEYTLIIWISRCGGICER